MALLFLNAMLNIQSSYALASKWKRGNDWLGNSLCIKFCLNTPKVPKQTINTFQCTHLLSVCSFASHVAFDLFPVIFPQLN